MSRRVRTALAALLAAVLGAVVVPGVAQAATVNYVALGDSYSSGVGAGPYDLSTCLRSQKSYAPLWAAAHSVTSFRFPACGGAVTADVIGGQVGALSTATTLVTITIGGNDAGFADVMTSCRFGSTTDCENAVGGAKAFATNVLPGRLDATYAAIRDRAPNARLVVLGYPRLFETGWCGLLAMSSYKRTILNQAADVLDGVIAARAGAAGATYVDARPFFAGHGVCAADPWIHDVSGLVEAYHPDADGYRYGYLAALTSAIG
ncbi:MULTISPECIES: SGNH/GDSL hydrolase family protein [Micromonospora]|uniref:SGNH/GDSL hydrolase family protein n=1 Tax=Micromonospora solifontis TaxID=2487138 RepID=A0ABX9WAM9_9ACTN|nr:MULTISPECIES: SGNH/GDSL hydrolase family protein [Micromonospora]NES12200.1 SGNH/GDSL hydrolase family protein [Micromonospora sp. PPF5-17B]NES39548.1 SGNH/GDSL hydrolase family protein [Micromonospora solifontis]NES54317.1 SGNH/GDSL hydrolase family protein [Micromonospora sp. PPF5-6]RNL88257.1 SGNH/GDSL hydrolase family protein [Micromonospora solifontis]